MSITKEQLDAMSEEDKAALRKSLGVQSAVETFKKSVADLSQASEYRAALKVAKSENADLTQRLGAMQVLKDIDMATGDLYREEISNKALLVADLKCPYAELLLSRVGEPIKNIVFQYTSWATSEKADYLMNDHEFTIDNVNSADAIQEKFTGKCATLAVRSVVTKLANSHVLPDGTKRVDRNIMNAAYALVRQLNDIVIDGDQEVNAKEFDGLNAHQKKFGAKELRSEQGGAALTFAKVNDLITKAQSLGGGDMTHILLNPYDLESLRKEFVERNSQTGRGTEKLKEFESTTAGTLKFLVDTKAESVKKLEARAEHDNGAVQFTGTINVGDKVTIAGVEYTAADSQSIENREFLAGTPEIAMASFNQVVASYSQNGGKAAPLLKTATSVDFVAVKAGAIGNDYGITKSGDNITVNAGSFSGGKNSTVYILNIDTIELREFEIAGKKGFQTHIVENGEYNFDRRDITWIGGVAYYNKNGIAVIENVG